jgi:alkanesulfonate monooxygenase SsuD/methylene tetrahydromethanopterin reductase-like flavin-dependent oxidoreductase (luciferase family)
MTDQARTPVRNRIRLGLRYDFRSLSDAGRSERYRAAVDQCAWADSLGFDYVRLNEHHGAEDGYLPSPLVVAAAIGARTESLTVRTSLVVLPLHDPLRIAEDAAVADLVSGGRLELAVGAGYVPSEFEMFGRSRDERVTRLEDGVAVLRQAWTGEPFTYAGRTVWVTPRPTNGSIPVYLGGTTKGAARRAARIADGFEPSSADLAIYYEAERARLGRLDGDPRTRAVATGTLRFLHVAEDPETAWAVVGPHALHEMRSYARCAATLAGQPKPRWPNTRIPP